LPKIRIGQIMNKRRILKLIHFLGTVWFALCAGYVLIVALRQAGVRWWVIFSLSGHSIVLLFLLVSLYLFAVFRGADRSQQFHQEHPMSSTGYYMLFYGTVPFLGGIAGLAGEFDYGNLSQSLLAVVYGTIGATFLVWIVIDPAIGMIEMLLPASRKHRKERLQKIRELREQQQRERDRLLKQLKENEKVQYSEWQKLLQPLSGRLSELVFHQGDNWQERENQAIDIGVKAWQIGGLAGMKQLHEMTISQYKSKHQEFPEVDYITLWWDGIGSWQHKPLSENIL